MLKSLNIFQGYFRYLSVYRRFLGNKIFILVGLNLMAAVADSLGIMMLLPLLKMSEMTGDSLGEKTDLLLTIIRTLGIPQTMTGVLFFIGAVFVIKSIIKFVDGGVQGYFVTQLQKKLKSRLLKYYTTVDYRFYINRNTGHLINVITVQIDRFVSSFINFCRFNAKGITSLVYLACAATLNWLFTCIAVATGLVILILFRLLSNFARNLSIKVSFEASALNKFLVQILQSLKYLLSTSSVGFLHHNAIKSIDTMASHLLKQQVATVFTSVVREPISILFLIGIVLIQIMVFQQPLAPILVTVLLFYRAVNAIVTIQVHWQDIMNGVGGLEMSLDEFEQVQKNQEIPGRRKVGRFNNKIVFNNVSFSYGYEDVLKEISLAIPLNESIAIVGESGVGKSTLIDLITLLLKPSSGTITVDGIPHQDIDYFDWRQNIAMVTQDTVVFDDTIANNICLWACDYEKDETCRFRIEEAAIRAYCHQFIHEMPELYQSVVGDRGIKLSGGQRQRLSIARELFKNPRLLILDEATSSLDTESERYIQKSIDEFKGKIALVIIAHRLSTIKNVDRIYVLEKGRIIEQGSYEELQARERSHLGRMVAMQSL